MSNVRIDTPPTTAAAQLEGQAPVGANEQAHTRKDMGGIGDGTGNKPPVGRPTLPPPTMSAAAMMIALTALNSKLSSESIAFGENTLDGMRKDLKDQAHKRAEQLKKHFDNLDKVHSKKKCGLFGAIANFFKKLFTGDIGGAFKVLADNIGSILKDVMQIVALAVALAASVALAGVTAGAASPAIAVVIAGAALVLSSMVLSDPAVMEAMINSLPEDKRQAAGIALAIVAAVIALAGSIMMAAASGGAGSITIATRVTSLLSAAADVAATLQQGVDGYLQSGYKAEAMTQQGEMDKTDARMTDIKGAMDRNQKDLKALFDAFSKILESTSAMIQVSGQNMSRAASV